MTRHKYEARALVLATIIFAALTAGALSGIPGFQGPAPAHANVTSECKRNRAQNYVDEGETIRIHMHSIRHGETVRGNWYVVGATATAGEDYEDPAGRFQEGVNDVTGEFRTVEDRYSEKTETVTFRFVTDGTGPTGQGAQCTFSIIDDDDTGAYRIQIISSPADGETYRLGETIEIAMHFTSAVNVQGDVLVGLRLGEGSWFREAEYQRGTRTGTLVFSYTVQSGDLDLDGISVPPSNSFRGSGQITSRPGRRSTSPFNPRYRGLGDQAAHKVDGRTYATATEIVSIAANGVTYRAGETIDIALTYNNPVEVEGNVLVNLRMGTGSWWRGAAYSRGSGTDTLVFSYTVQPGDLDTDGVSLDGSYVDAQGVPQGYGGDGAMKVAGTDVPVHHYYPALSHHSYHKVDGVKPTISSAAVAADGSTVTVTFTENIQVAPLVRWFIENEGLTEGISEFINAVLNVEVNNAWPIPTAATVSGNTVTVTLPTPISSGEAVQVRYDGVFANDAPGVLVDNVGNPMTNFGATAATNNSTVTTHSGAGNVVLSVRERTITEGNAATYTVRLGAKPKEDVAVVAILSNAPSNVTISETNLTFTPDNWDRAQTVTVSSTADDNEYGYWVGITHIASGSGFTGQDTLKVLMQE